MTNRQARRQARRQAKTWTRRAVAAARGGGWGEWEACTRSERPDMPEFVVRAWKNRQYIVQLAPQDTSIGRVDCLMVRRVDAKPHIPWADLQRIKNELAGPERVAVEVYPAESDLVDAANMYHLWVLPPECELAYGLHKDGFNNEKGSDPHGQFNP